MKISAKAEYACVAMVELAIRHQKNLPTSLKVIADGYKISQAFLMQIFLQLKGAGLVTSIRGSTGGYSLARAPEQIRIADIVDVIDGPPSATSALSALPESAVVNVLQGIWQKINAAERNTLADFTISDVQKQAHETGAIFYQI